MRVGIDLRPLRPLSSGGLVKLTEGLCRALFMLAPEDVFVVYCSAGSYRLPGPLPQNVSEVLLPDDGEPVWLDAGLARDRADVLFRPFPIDDALAFPLRRRFVLVPDLQHETFPEYFSTEELASRRQAFSQSINQGGAVGLLSRHTHDRLRANFPDAPARVVFVPPGPPLLARTLATPLSEAEQRLVPEGPFFLYPANLWPHKNHRRLILAFQRFLARQPGAWSLVLTGNDLLSQEELLAEFPSLPIHHLGFVSSRLLAELYQRCTALTYFSLYEGFGIPLLEAFQLGAPVLCSNTTSLLEVGGDAALPCDPTDIPAMAALMEQVADSPKMRVELQRRGLAQLERYDWDTSARSLLDALRELAQEPVGHGDVLYAIQALGAQLEASQADRHERGRVIDELQRALGDRIARADHERTHTISSENLASPGPPHETADDAGLLVSVVLPLVDHRGQALRSVRSWACGQSLLRDRYEVIVVSDGSEPELEARVRELLSPHDRLIVGPSGSELRLYDLGAREAQGRWLFFTEAHSFGERQCLEATVRYLDETGLDGACCRSQGVATNLLARMESRIFDEVTPRRLAPAHWSKLFLRGTALSRELYLKAGGFIWRYGLFAEPELAARLHSMGHTLGYVSTAVVRHFNTHTMSALRESIHDYTRGESLYRLEHPAGEGDVYFGTPEWWGQRSLLDPDVDRNLWRSLSKSLLHPNSEWRARRKRWVELLPAAVLGTRWRVWRVDWTAWQAQARCWWWRNQEERLSTAYHDLWPALTRQGGIHALTAARRRATVPTCTPHGAFVLADLPEEWHTGFHDIEEFDGDRFRWSGPIACLKLPLEPGNQILRLDTRGLRPELRLEAFLNGQPLRIRDIQAELGELQITLCGKYFRPGPFQYLSLLCEPLRPWLQGVPDQRELGLPLFRIVRA